MLVDIQSEEDLARLESAILSMLGAQRLDVSVLKSKPYIDLRQTILRNLQGKPHARNQSCTYFSMEDLVLRIVSSNPIIVWCDKRDVLPMEDEESI
jgi:hypothetical protein